MPVSLPSIVFTDLNLWSRDFRNLADANKGMSSALTTFELSIYRVSIKSTIPAEATCDPRTASIEQYVIENLLPTISLPMYDVSISWVPVVHT